jgi:hypothetical protein
MNSSKGCSINKAAISRDHRRREVIIRIIDARVAGEGG